jgi:hypothetical protein
MPKPKVVQLVQSTKDKPVVVDLAADEVAMITGDMGGCVSVVVLWNPVDGVFQNVRGHHAAGGPGAVNWDELMAGVPEGQDTLLVIAPADKMTETEMATLKADLKAQVKTRRKFVNHMNCFIDRTSPDPNISGFDRISDGSKYTIRVPRSR